MTVNTVGLDLAKDVFQVHGISANGRVIFNKTVKRAKLLQFFEALPPCVVGMEACGSAHHWGRELGKLGHDVRLMPAGYVKPYVKRGKTDAVDAEAICEAVRRPTMRFVELKTEDQQAILAIHRTRDLVVRQQTQIVNMIRSILREFGHILPTGVGAILTFAKRHLGGDHPDMPELANGILGTLCHQLVGLNTRVAGYTRMIEQHAMMTADARRLMRIPGIGPITASAIIATIGDAKQFRTGRDLAAWLGLTPLNKSSGGKERLGKITKKGDRYIRKLLIVGMTSRALMARKHPERADLWTAKMLAQKPFRLATVAMANKAARIVWAMLTKQQDYRQPGT
ncbi:IS110 family transposase [Rhodovulum sulfidophilum]|uniref:IS110 family transposase n=5 Tax=Rhodovulum sulfidophilum TaxID=35806 RepID=UPI0009525AFF|nr:IS110 family transposase [Rhodovulum sulfidophilum]MBL3563302.1 IS110 family transposase [Rhodovulum sulfidophilum]OLS53129.1 IS110 family transposase [Rhodovulum sulfidophilum]